MPDADLSNAAAIGPQDDPATEGSIAVVMGKVEEMRCHFKKQRDHSRWVATATKVTAITAGALLTVLIGLRPVLPNENISAGISVTALIISAGLTALATWESFADHRWKWVRYRASLSALYALGDDMRFRSNKGKPMSVAELDSFYSQLRQIIHETNEEWMGKRSPIIAGPTDPTANRTNSSIAEGHKHK